MQKPKLLILDEPTSVLTPQAVRRLFETLRALASEGCSILYISHKLDEIQALCDVATVLRAGRVTATCVPSEETPQSMAQMMIGTALPVPRHRPGAAPREARLRLAGLSHASTTLRRRPRGHPSRCPRRGDRGHRGHLGQWAERAAVGDIG
jgi:simple sugar transport system ATP-binding protein